jgi:DNA-directed RNA polymerase specialized sigma24 family protein
MIDNETRNRLENIDQSTWKLAIEKCYIHLRYKLRNKTQSGAHCSQRLGAEPFDYYVSKCIKGIYSGTWEWFYQRFTIAEQMIRIINSMISEQVRKYKVENTNTKHTVLADSMELFTDLDIEDDLADEEDGAHLERLNEALELACEGNKQYKQFILYKREGLGYDEICKKLNCTQKEAYQMMETISRRANKKLGSL